MAVKVKGRLYLDVKKSKRAAEWLDRQYSYFTLTTTYSGFGLKIERLGFFRVLSLPNGKPINNRMRGDWRNIFDLIFSDGDFKSFSFVCVNQNILTEGTDSENNVG